MSAISFIGIDSGLNGGITVIGPVTMTSEKTPIIDGEKRQMNLPACAAILRKAKEIGPAFATIEKVGAMPKQGVSSTFAFGKGYGAWLGLLAAHDIPYQEVTPQRWKKVMLDGTQKDKGASISRASQLFPFLKLIPDGCRVPHDGIAESALIAELGRRMYLGENK